jgi:hypothetical protein
MFKKIQYVYLLIKCGFLEGSCVPVLYIGRTVPKGYVCYMNITLYIAFGIIRGFT